MSELFNPLSANVVHMPNMTPTRL